MTIQEKLTTPIRVPANPFWDVLKTFGRDELIGAGISLLSTASLQLFIPTNSSPTARIILALIGPITEKIGFFLGHIKDARDIYRTTVVNDRKPFSHYVKHALRGGFKTLLQDLLVHDPIYVALMLGGMSIHPATPAWLLVPIAFTVALLIVTVGEVGFNELRYYWFQRQAFSKGFEREHYLEARFCLDRIDSVANIIQKLRDQFLPGIEIFSATYKDAYYESTLPTFNARGAKTRLRSRTRKDGSLVNTAQIVYIRTIEEENGPSQFRFFPQRKDKFYLVMDQPGVLDDSSFFKNCVTSDPPKLITFERYVVFDPKKIFLSIDVLANDVHNTNPLILEIKVYPDQIVLLKEAMRFVMHHFPVQQTTHSKLDLVS